MASLITPDGEQSKTDPAETDVSTFPSRTKHSTVLMTWPVYMEPTGVATDESDNPEMSETPAALHRTGYKQWWRVLQTYDEIEGIDATTMNPLSVWETLNDEGATDVAPPEELPDIVFCANVALPFPDEKKVLLSEMAADSRRDEPRYAEVWFEQQGYEVTRLNSDVDPFEGTGDAIWHPGRRLLWGGVGERTERKAYEEIAQRMDTTVITLDPANEIDGDTFFHLDICFSALDEETVMIIPEVFDDDDLRTIESVFDTVIECPLSEGRPGNKYANNAHCPDGENVIIQSGAEKTIAKLEDAGYTVHPVDTSAFIDACSGSVFCMKLALP